MNLIFFCNFLVGASLASHACLIYDRFEDGNIVWARSECESCHYQLSLLDEIPILSYLYLKGKCRYCGEAIPYQLLLCEFWGGVSFCYVDFSNINGIVQAIFIFFLLLISIFDYHDGEFPTILLLPLLIIVPSANLSKILLIELVPIIMLLTYYVVKKQMGLGDLIVYIFLCLYFGTHKAGIALLIACLTVVINYFSNKNYDKQIYFLPYIMIGFTIMNIF